jgi:hypothetical protein
MTPKNGERGRGIIQAANKRAGRKVGKNFQLQLNPGLRDRLFKQMDESNIQEDERLGQLCLLTGRVPQTVRRWIDRKTPGLPDLMSFAVLCVRFQTDANWLLGLTDIKYPLPAQQAQHGETEKKSEGFEWLDYITRQVAEKGAEGETFCMPGDEMEPRIKKGAPILVNTSIKEIEGNGIYVLQYQGRTIVRIVEDRIGEGLVLSCENKQYKDTVLKDAATATKLGLKVIGKAELWVQLASS